MHMKCFTKSWHRWHDQPPHLRWPAKLAGFLIVLLLVLYPRIWLVPTWLSRVADFNAVIDPQNPRLAPLAAQVRANIPHDATIDELLAATEITVNSAVPYAFDWDTWGVMDYLPTVDETLDLGREDCDGRAVVAASLIRRLGYDAWLVCDIKHTWVIVRAGQDGNIVEREIMAPGTGDKSLAALTNDGAETGGTRVRWSWGLFTNAARGLAFGVAVFPLERELILLAAVCLLTVHPGTTRMRGILGCLLLAAALAMLRLGGAVDGRPSSWLIVVVAVGGGLAGWLLLAIRRRSHGTPPPKRA